MSTLKEKLDKDGCQSCGMPLYKDPGPRESDIYCSFCYQNGAFTYQGTDRKEFEKIVYAQLRARQMNPIVAKMMVFIIRFLPRWEAKK